jgi:hypothetical protein
MGTTDPAEIPHGFSATKLAENALGKVIKPLELLVPQELRLKR